MRSKISSNIQGVFCCFCSFKKVASLLFNISACPSILYYLFLSVHSSTQTYYLSLLSPLAPPNICHRTHYIWVSSVHINKKGLPSQSLELDVKRTFYHFVFPIFCRTSHLSLVAAVASLNRTLQCISGDKRIVMETNNNH